MDRSRTRTRVAGLGFGVIVCWVAISMAEPGKPLVDEEDIPDAEIVLRKDSSVAIVSPSGVVARFSCNKNGADLGIARGTKAVATISLTADGKARVHRYIRDGDFDISIQDTDGDGIPDRLLRWQEGELVQAFTIETKLVEIPKE